MKRMLPAIAAMLLVITAPGAMADADEVVDGMADRAVRGATNAVTGIVEFPMQIVKGYQNGVGFIENEAGSKTVGVVLGFFRGIGHAAGRTGYGFMELFGFWAVAPEDNEDIGVPLDAEYAWEEGEQYSLFKPTLGEGIQPIPNKLLRGLGNGFLGIAELPGQILLGIDNGEVGTGIVKGIWFTLSRHMYGIGEAFGCLVPNPADTRGVTFDQEWPWDALSNR
jgi:hypothetical protein